MPPRHHLPQPDVPRGSPRGKDSDSDVAQKTIAGATVDLGRSSRCGFGEVIYGEGKSADLVTRIARTQLHARQDVLITRIDAATAKQVQEAFPRTQYNGLARTLRIGVSNVAPAQPLTESAAREQWHAAVVTAGSTDEAVAAEATETLAWMGVPFQSFTDIGVAGPQRLAAAVPRLQLASALVVIAGMEGALPAAVAGYLPTPIFAVPTSVGYGTSLGGLTPLLGMLSSCSASVAVVNIDAGFKGGYMAGLVVSQLQACRAKRPKS
tara:strand:+ start:5536 stop:6333 length:798 start_codon:yes stop_codon:yes gene_type:complete